MAWAQADADQLRAAVLALASGTRVVTVKYEGPPAREITYGSADLAALRSLLKEMDDELSPTVTVAPPAFRRVSFRKGFP